MPGLIVSAVFGIDPRTQLGGGGGMVEPPPASAPASNDPIDETAAERELAGEQRWVIRHAQDFWTQTFRQGGQRYQRARRVLFRDAVQSGCGFAESATGPFYCPRDQKVYIDLGFSAELARRFGALGDFAQADVLAHEVGHHVQNLLDTERELRRAQQANPRQANALSVRMELQADCSAGIWVRQAAAEGHLESGDLEEALRAAAAWATIASCSRRAAGCSWRASRTARRSSGRRGSVAASTAATCGSATRSVVGDFRRTVAARYVSLLAQAQRRTAFVTDRDRCRGYVRNSVYFDPGPARLSTSAQG